MTRPFDQVDVFCGAEFGGNPVAVVHGAEGLGTEAMHRVARWTDLSETTFVLPPRDHAADYRLRIFTPTEELRFAGHPTLGSCHAWLERGGRSANGGLIIQECGAGPIEIRRDEAGRLAFTAPPLLRSGPVDVADLAPVIEALGIEAGDVVDAAWADNGPGWLALLLSSAQGVLDLRPRYVDQDVGVAGLHSEGADPALEVRAFFPKNGQMVEDPVTGSLNASLAQWLTATGRLSLPYVATQGTSLGRTGRAHISGDAAGAIWVAGETRTRIRGEIDL